MSVIRGTRHPVGTWLVCRQCRQFYTRVTPCPCRSQSHEEEMGRWERRLRGLRVIVNVLARLRRRWHGSL